jgi:hypothetical protein
MNSSGRQLGQCLGVAVTGSVLDGSLHGPMQSGFPAAARGSWLIMAGCGMLVLVAALAGNSPRSTRSRGPHGRQTPRASPVPLPTANGYDVAARVARLRRLFLPVGRHRAKHVSPTGIGSSEFAEASRHAASETCTPKS